ncbi:MAG: DHA2 family efflux MFS transporter permease subunit [Chloroflexi bacterium]|nr:MAG: DHA2 family efflux MFS transporter permease subunit [Chloroflexota bacterium]
MWRHSIGEPRRKPRVDAPEHHRPCRSPGARRPGREGARPRRSPVRAGAPDPRGQGTDRGDLEARTRASVRDRRRNEQRRPGAAAPPVSAAGRERQEGAGQVITQGLSRNRVILATAGTALALLLAALDQTIVGTAIPRIVADLNGLDRLAWVTTAYLVTSTTMTPIAGKLGDLFGRKPFLLAGMIGFVAASALCGLSQDMTQLIVFRGIQGIFGGVLFATVFTVIGDLFPPESRGRVQGLFGGVFGLSSIVGPTAGGFITDHWSWRWVFEVNIPVGIVAVAVVLAGLPYVRSKASWRDIDFFGAVTLAAGVVPLLIALSITRDHAWTSPEVEGLLALAAVMLAAFVFVESRVEHPIVPLELFKNTTFTVSMVVGFLTAFGMFGSILFTPLVFQGVLGISATNSGALITPMMFGLLGASTLTGFAMRRVKRYRYLGTLGVAVMIVGMYLLSLITPSMPEWRVVAALIVVGLGLGTTFPLYLTAVQVALPRSYMGVASSQIQFWRNLGGTVGSSILGAVLANRLPDYLKTRIGELHLPPQALQHLPSGGANAVLQPGALSQLPPAVATAIRLALSDTLRDIYIFAGLILIAALVATVFLKEVPLAGVPTQAFGEPVPEDDDTKAREPVAV